jgi:hypothetical protein
VPLILQCSLGLLALGRYKRFLHGPLADEPQRRRRFLGLRQARGEITFASSSLPTISPCGGSAPLTSLPVLRKPSFRPLDFQRLLPVAPLRPGYQHEQQKTGPRLATCVCVLRSSDESDDSFYSSFSKKIEAYIRRRVFNLRHFLHSFL